MTVEEALVMAVCLSIGAILGFSLTGNAALGTAAGAAVWFALDHRLRPRHPR
jgi:hypothetical protein